MSVIQTMTRYYTKSKRLLFKSTRRPKGSELKITSRIVALGILFIGFIGFIINLVVQFLVEATG